MNNEAAIAKVALMLRFGDAIEFRRDVPDFAIFVNQNAQRQGSALIDAHRSYEELITLGHRVTDAWETPTR